jgi:xylulose-5-phosphate/fructose-6-phosphate phosphoketolase
MTLSKDLLRKMNAYWRAANYLSVGQIYLRDNPLLREPLQVGWLIHQLTYRRANHRNIHVRGYKEEGTTTTPFDMVVLNELDRFHRVGDVIDRVPNLGARAAYAKQHLRDALLDHENYIRTHGEDMPSVRNWEWSSGRAGPGGNPAV